MSDASVIYQGCFPTCNCSTLQFSEIFASVKSEYIFRFPVCKDQEIVPNKLKIKKISKRS